MMLLDKRILAAKKAADTLRLNLLSKVDLSEVIDLSNAIIAKEYEIDDDFSRQAIIAREISKTTWRSFCRYGGQRNASKILMLIWINKEGMALDEQATWMNEAYSIDIMPDELADFMINYDHGKGTYEDYASLKQLKGAFKDVCRFSWDIKFVRRYIIRKHTTVGDMLF